MKLSALSSPGFTQAINKLLAASLPVKTAFKLKKYVDQIQPELKHYEELKKALFDEFSVKDENGETLVKDGMISLDMAKADQWQPKAMELNDLESDAKLELSLDDLGDKVELSAADLVNLGDLLKE
jgi:hypothetical protein